MEHFIVSARKYRPKTFKDVVGQSAITNTLENAIANDHLAQALLFCGPRGVGKTSCARILARMINTEEGTDANEDFAFNIFELDAASNNTVDDIRNLIDQVRIPPQIGNYKVYIIDEVHMLSQAAFNAFLKTLEEPPQHAIFILATTEKHKIIPTILSRCQIFDFKRITVKDTADYLTYIAKNQGVIADEEALHIIAKKADGALRDALSIFDRVVSFTGTELTRQAVTENLNVLDYDTYLEVTNHLLEGDIPEVLLALDKILARGFDAQHFIVGLASHFRDLMVCKHQATIKLLEVGEQTQEKYRSQSEACSPHFLMKALDIANGCDLQYRTSKNQRLLIELGLMKIASIEFDGEKKNSKSVLIPASYFRNKTKVMHPQETLDVAITVKNSSQQEENTTQEVAEDSPKETKEIIKEIASNPKIDLGKHRKKVSGLSLSSIRAKKEHEIRKMDVVIEEQELPVTPFDIEQLMPLWNAFIDKLRRDGRNIFASNLAIDTPKLLPNYSIELELANDTMKKEIEREQHELLGHLRKELQNYEIRLVLIINETSETKYAVTAEDKFELLTEQNPLLHKLRKDFDLQF
ncbi:MAG: DNA polymerase III subunit gamma/tau [Flavobacteriaceae bacterium]|nr:DNA polymerase III subunit gamma/tau [Flavobacteriaceae bacterium]